MSIAPPTDNSRQIEFRVRYAETDQMRVVYHSNYLVWCEIGRTEFIRTLGKSYADLEKEDVALAVVDAQMRFHAAARYDDLIRVTTRLTEASSRLIAFSYVISNAATGEKLVSVSTRLAALNGKGKPAKLPDQLRTVLENALS